MRVSVAAAADGASGAPAFPNARSDDRSLFSTGRSRSMTICVGIPKASVHRSLSIIASAASGAQRSRMTVVAPTSSGPRIGKM
jgi:hypothetical protein